METITSRTNALVARIRKLAAQRKERRGQGVMVGEGPKLLREALGFGAQIEAVLWQAGADPVPGLPQGVRQAQVPEDLFRWLAPTETPQKVIFLCKIPSTALPRQLTGERYLVLDGLQDPGNLGTLWRTADAFGADGLILLPGCADPWSPKTVRATMGACFRLPVYEGSLEEVRERLDQAKLPLYATALREDTEDLRALSLSRAAVVIGSEGKGVSPAVLAASEKTVKIPMLPRCESLNAAVAGAVVLWQMGFGGEGHS